MNPDDVQELNELLDQIQSMKVHGSSRLGAALKKPILLLLLISRIENDRVEENRFQFDDIEKRLGLLIREHGGRPTDSGPKPEQPFSHLRSSPFWILKTQRQYAQGYDGIGFRPSPSGVVRCVSTESISPAEEFR